MADKTQKLVLSIVDFLQQSITDGTVKQEDSEGLEVAIQCIAEAFSVDHTDPNVRQRLSVKPATLPSIFDVYLKTRDKVSQQAQPASSNTSPSAEPSGADKQAAETFKQAGGSLMAQGEYTEALEAYTKAINLVPTNPVYYSNRAAAHSSLDDHYSAVEDAQKALQVDPKFVKAYSRAGHAYYCLADYENAADQYKKGLELDPSNANLKGGLENSMARISATASSTAPTPAASSAPRGGMPDLSALLGGGGGGAGGMPDLSSLLSNPALMQMAQGMMADGGLERMMANPSVRNMVDRMQSGGGMPTMQDIMSDPALRDMAANLGGAGRGGPTGNP